MEDWETFDHDAFNNFRVSTFWMVLSETGLDGAPMVNPSPGNVGNVNPGSSTNARARDPVME
jgi:hypothetical protein